MPDWLAILKAYTDTLEAALGNPTGDMRDVTQDEAATLAAYLINFREMVRAHDQTRICLIVPNLANLASDAPNTAIKAELDKIATVTVLDEAGVDDGQEDWDFYDAIVVGSDTYDPFVLGNLDSLILMKVPVMVCNSAVAAHLKMGADTAGSSANTVNEWCKSIHNRVMYLVFGSTGDKELFSEATVSDRLDMSDASLTPQLLMTSLVGDTNTTAVVCWLPMDKGDGTINTLDDDTDMPACRLFAGCFVNADKLTALGTELLRRMTRNFAQAGISPALTLKAAAAQVAAILVDTGTTIPALLAIIDNEIATIDTEVGNIETKLDTPANFMADVSALALEATLGTHDTDIKALLATIAGYIDAEVDAILADVTGIAGAAMRGTDNATLRATWTDALATALAAYTAARGAYLDELAAANIPADIDGLKTSRDRQLFSMDFWSVPQISVVVPAGAANQALPSVVVDIPVGATVVKATAMFKFRMLDNAGAVNKLSGAQHIQVKKGAGAYADAISLVDDQFGIGEATREGGDIVIGDHNMVATVDADETYGFQWTAANADIAGLTFNDVQTGLRIWYSV